MPSDQPANPIRAELMRLRQAINRLHRDMPTAETIAAAMAARNPPCSYGLRLVPIEPEPVMGAGVTEPCDDYETGRIEYYCSRCGHNEGGHNHIKRTEHTADKTETCRSDDDGN